MAKAHRRTTGWVEGFFVRVSGLFVAMAAVVASQSARADDVVSFPRFRWGVSGEGGPYYRTTGDSGGLGGLSGHLGVQFTPYFSMYAQATTLIGGGVAIFSDATTTTISTSVVATAMFAPVAEVDVDYLYVSLAPELVFAATAGPMATSGTFFGLDARVGLWAPKPSGLRSRRQGVTFGIDLHTVFTPNAVMLVPLIAIGWATY